MEITLREFAAELTGSGLMADEQVTRCLSQFGMDVESGDAATFAQKLVTVGRLTSFQADAVGKKNAAALVIGDYHVLDVIGEGGMGLVYKARHRFMDRVVAIKVMHTARAGNANLAQRFAREVKAAAALNHPNIVTAYDAGQTADGLYLAMEYVDGPDISQVLHANGALSVDQAVNITIQAARGLAFAHARNIVHRDIKPANLLLGRDGMVKILDMGLARFTEEAEHSTEVSLTMAGRLMGTIEYMAPEHAASAKDADHRSDIYSLGCAMYRMLTGKLPYGGTTPVEKLIAQREHPIPSLSDTSEQIPAVLQGIFARMVAKKPEDRYQSADEVIADLTAAAPNAEKCAVSNLAVMKVPAVAPESSGDAVETTPDALDAGELLQVASEDEPTPMGQSANFPGVSVSQPPAGEYEPVTDGIPVARKADRKKLLVAAIAFLALVGIGVGLWAILSPSALAPEPAPRPSLPTGKAKIYTQWPYDAAEAVRRRDETAKALGVEPEMELDLGGGVKMKLVLIPAGEFVMGSPRSEVGFENKDIHAHKVTISRPFYMGVTEVTQEQYTYFMERAPGAGGFHPPQEPAQGLFWEDATAFCEAMSKKTQRLVRLPTEAQWEYACRAGANTRFSFGDNEEDSDAYGWCKANSGRSTHPVGQKKPNPWGLYDMHGNVSEWCRDWHDRSSYLRADIVDLDNTTKGRPYALRGGELHRQRPPGRAALLEQTRLPPHG